MSRTLAISDIHGCYDALMTMVEFCKLGAKDCVITLGDYVDRGPDSRAVLDWLIEFDKTGCLNPLRGNHDVMMAEAQNGPDSFERWCNSGGDTALSSYAAADDEVQTLSLVPPAHWRFISERLLPYFETEKHLFVHASYRPNLPMSDLPDSVLYWEKYAVQPRHQSGRRVICGHTSQKSGLPLVGENAICIDTKVYDENGWLSCLDVSTGKLWQSNQRGETREQWIDGSSGL